MYRVYPWVAAAAVAVYTVRKQTKHAVLVVGLPSKKYFDCKYNISTKCLRIHFKLLERIFIYFMYTTKVFVLDNLRVNICRAGGGPAVFLPETQQVDNTSTFRSSKIIIYAMILYYSTL
jgi:hypothetical protein